MFVEQKNEIGRKYMKANSHIPRQEVHHKEVNHRAISSKWANKTVAMKFSEGDGGGPGGAATRSTGARVPAGRRTPCYI